MSHPSQAIDILYIIDLFYHKLPIDQMRVGNLVIFEKNL